MLDKPFFKSPPPQQRKKEPKSLDMLLIFFVLRDGSAGYLLQDAERLVNGEQNEDFNE